MLTYKIAKPEESFIEFKIEEGDFAGKILKSDGLQPCMDLSCGCGNIYFADETEQLYALDVEQNHIFQYLEKEVITSEKDQYLKTLKDQVTENQWLELKSFYRDLKGMASEARDANKIDVHFEDYKKILQESQMVPYYMALPWSFDLNIEIDERVYWITDYYCVQPACKCTNALLILSFDNTPSLELWFDYKTQIVKLGEIDDKRLPALKIINEIQNNQLEKFKEIVTNRHERMVIFFNNFLKKNNITPPVKPPALIVPGAIGRNDLCSCGSGLKYKKCCGS